MNEREKNLTEKSSSLMKMVEAISIDVDSAREVVKNYKNQIKKESPQIPPNKLRDIIVKKIINRYSKLSASSGAATGLAGIVPGIGTAVSAIGGGMADISISLKLQIDMTMCLAVAINEKMTNEDAKHISYIIALYGSLEKAGAAGATKIASKAGVKLVKTYLSGQTLLIIKQMFAKIGIVFTKKAALKAIPFGVGVVIGGSSNYALTKYVGKAARDTLIIHASEET